MECSNSCPLAVSGAPAKYYCYNHFPYLEFSSQSELDNHVNSVHGGWLEYNKRFKFGLHTWFGIRLPGTKWLDWTITAELNERIPAPPQIGPWSGFVAGPGSDVYVQNPYTDRIIVECGYNDFGDQMQALWLAPKGDPGGGGGMDKGWFGSENKWLVELHYSYTK